MTFPVSSGNFKVDSVQQDLLELWRFYVSGGPVASEQIAWVTDAPLVLKRLYIVSMPSVTATKAFHFVVSFKSSTMTNYCQLMDFTVNDTYKPSKASFIYDFDVPVPLRSTILISQSNTDAGGAGPVCTLFYETAKETEQIVTIQKTVKPCGFMDFLLGGCDGR